MQANLFDKSEKNFTSRESSPDKTDSTVAIGFSTLPLTTSYTQHDTDPSLPVRFRRSGSERLKDGAKAFLRRVESIKSRRRKRQNRDGVVISEPQALDLTQINQKISDLKCIEVKSTPPSPIPTSPYVASSKSPTNNNITNDLKVFPEFSRFSANRLSPKHFTSHRTSQSSRTSPLHFFSTTNPNIVIDLKSGDESSSYYSDASQDSCGEGRSATTIKKRPTRTRRFLQKDRKVEDIGAVSDSECHQTDFMSQSFFKDSSETSTTTNSELKPPKLLRGRSLNLGKESNRYRSALKSNSFRSISSSRRKDDKDGDGKARSRLVVVDCDIAYTTS